MRHALIVTLIAAILLPGVASATSRKACRRMERQIDRYETMVERAEAQKMAMWADGTEAHLDRLEDKFMDRCPEYAGKIRREKSMEATRKAVTEFMKTAGRAAVTFFTAGAM